MTLKVLFCILIFGLYNTLLADVKVAFIEARNLWRTTIEYEPQGRFFHTAISVGDQWLHAHPRKGVELIDDLTEFGPYKEILRTDQYEEPNENFLRRHLNLPFNLFTSWNHDLSTYCSKIIGKFFNIKPEIMRFESPGWKNIPNLPRGELGLSPDDLYKKLQDIGFKKSTSSLYPSCRSFFSSKK